MYTVPLRMSYARFMVLCVIKKCLLQIFHTDCGKNFTVLFLVDTARDVGSDNLKRQIEFIISVASTINFNHIAVISYATKAEVVITPGQSSNFSEFAQTLREANYSLDHLKNLGKAFEKAQEISHLFTASKPGITVAMISGKSHDDPAPPATDLKKRGVTIVAIVFTGAGYSMVQVSLFVSKPDTDHIVTTEFSSLKYSVNIARDAICKGEVYQTPKRIVTRMSPKAESLHS